MRRMALALLGAAMVLCAIPGLADGPGNVVESQSRCNYVLIHTPLGFSLAEWYGGVVPVTGDKISGRLATRGLTTLEVGPLRQETLVNITEALMTQEVAINRYMRLCR